MNNLSLTEQSLKQMEPAISLSLINMKLRNQFSSWQKLTSYYDLSEGFTEQLLLSNNWHYDQKHNQLKLTE
ncbi:DUF4250 family protein [Endozoicomonas montiporae]|uniref:Uncharacterized protein n=1 Tax=Endozoicomonas montiporae CL-33 TaxID=570277 RepID=A0A142BBI1_9GAMM|nr:hypothetical protein EZMO1_1984 [Endozoicomonas montiporae CL-33]